MISPQTALIRGELRDAAIRRKRREMALAAQGSANPEANIIIIILIIFTVTTTHSHLYLILYTTYTPQNPLRLLANHFLREMNAVLCVPVPHQANHSCMNSVREMSLQTNTEFLHEIRNQLIGLGSVGLCCFLQNAIDEL